MAEVDAPAARTAAAAPLTAIAFGKLQSASSARSLPAAGNGLMDAFAEVFAQMSARADAPMAPAEPMRPMSPEESSSKRPAQEEREEPEREASEKGSTATFSESFQSEQRGWQPESLPEHRGRNLQEEPPPESGREPGATQETLLVDSPVHPTTPSDPSESATKIVGDELAKDTAPFNPLTSASVEITGQAERHPRDNHPASVQAGASNPQQTVEAVPTPSEGGSGIERDNPISNESVTARLPVDAEPDDSRRRQHRQRSDHRTDAAEAITSGSSPRQSQPSAAHSPTTTPTVPTAGELAVAPETTSSNVTNSSSSQAVHTTEVMAPVQNVALKLSRMEALSTPGGTGKGSAAMLDANQPAPPVTRSESAVGKTERSAADMVARVKLVQRVSKAFQHLGPEGGSVRLRLAPAELGTVLVEMHVKDRSVRARVVAESESAGALLREHLPELRARLESAGMQVERLDVETDSNNRGFDGHQNAHSHGQPSGHGRFRRGAINASPASPATRSEAAPLAAEVTAVAGHAVGVDVRL